MYGIFRNLLIKPTTIKINLLYLSREAVEDMAPFYYAVAKGRNPGVYHNWDECKSQVTHFSAPVFKKFKTQAEAENFIKQNGTSNSLQNNENVIPAYRSSYSGKNRNIYSQEVNTMMPPLKSTKFTEAKSLGYACGSSKEKVPGEFDIDADGYVNVYTDGACSRNGSKNAVAGLGVWFNDGHPLNVSRSVVDRVTNNAAEIQAVTTAARQAQKAGITKLKINTDSMFLISCITKWLPNWKSNGWKTSSSQPVINKTELLEMEEALKPLHVKWNHVNGHVGIHGNEMADKLAREGCLKK